MLKNIKSHTDQEKVRELLGYAVFPDPESVEEAVRFYGQAPGRELYGYESEGDLIGLVGFSADAEGTLTIHHLAVHPECRGAGYGRGQILELIQLKKPREIVAETDEDAVDFYRSIGFTVSSLGEKYPGTERFVCRYEAEPEEEE
ncbi:GNAT family N-acetyltransferase [Paenibacillus chitinolyticus]